MSDQLPNDLAAAVALAGVDVTLPERQLEDAIPDAITDRWRYLDGWHCFGSGLLVAPLFSSRDSCPHIALESF